MKTRALAFGCLLAVLASCEPYQVYEPEPAPEPIKPDVPPIRNTRIKLLVTSNLTYTAKDEGAARAQLPDQVAARLTLDGQAEGNTFVIASGEQQNFTLTFTVNNSGDSRFTGSVTLAGWGWGFISTINSGQYSYSNAPEMIDALTDKVYVFIKQGWHDTRKDQK